ncbi:OmpH family outer membrane protein [Deinococcus peraridilitoris]|uniref:Outer membrane protein n=1 Tax=Deinococcus peraridilitoris (strain DSM 19664 / LMG 22246 / CIP 109416 / KR-200) TaxID=937777 RepID=K9ZYT6_DEIPD|nr:OmpH family outer membrane protein [Deinococcus peraridilitoris]AFZ65920.1 outer membrane protein [Deinococcus peraridilitoris DSM 19664]
MKATKILPLAVIGALAFGTLAPQAQNTAQKMAYVDVQAVVKAHPQFGALDTLNKQAEAALKPTRDSITTIQNKGQNATAAERQQYDQLVKTYQTNAKTWEDRINAQNKPILESVNAAVATAAKAQGVTMVLDKNIAATSQLVIYADPSLDLTSAVTAQIKK